MPAVKGRTLVFEIGTEEMPAASAAAGVAHIQSEARKLFQDFRLKTAARPQDTIAYGSPRRLVLIVSGLAQRQESAVEEVRGPPGRAAFGEDGLPTKAGEGFAKSQGVDVKDLEIRKVEGREYVYAVKEHPGLAVEEVLPDLLTSLMKSLEFPKTMRWGSGQTRFIRPIRWLLALYGDKVIPLDIDGLDSGRLTFGHRFLAEGPFELEQADDYKKTMAQAKVNFSNEALARKTIEEKIEKVAKTAGGRAVINERVLGEVAYLVEDAHAVVGGYDKDFLKIPRPVLVTAMESHQRYFPIEDDKGRLLPLFVVIHNGDPVFDSQIRHGHERVLRARLADAAFFFHEDTKTSLESKVLCLKDVVWQAELGTIFEKIERTRLIGGLISEKVGLNRTQREKVDRAILLSKADLTSLMVIEFPDLQGVIGREYALVDKEDTQVANAISEHYKPRFAGDEPASSLTGQVTALADKIDTITGCFLLGLIPTGSADPYSLRRQAAGIIGILSQTDWQIGILELVKLAIDTYTRANISSKDAAEIAAKIRDFIDARLKRSLSDVGEPDTIEAVLAAGFDNVGQIIKRVRLIEESKGKKELEDIKLAFTRCQNLADLELGDQVSEGLFEDNAEKQLFIEANQARARMLEIVKSGDLSPSLELLASMKPSIDSFFDAVLVMAPDLEIRANRLRLLNQLVGISSHVADFSKMV